MTRLVRLMAKLHNAAPAGVFRDELISIAGYGESDPGTQLTKDLNHLRQQGWQIDNISPAGTDACYRMVSRDNRLWLRLTAAQRDALQRAIILANRTDIAQRLGVTTASLPEGLGSAVIPTEETAELTLALQSLRLQSPVRFRYKGTMRTVHPVAVRFQHVQWYLSGVEAGGVDVKHFAIGRMSDVSLGPPGEGRADAEVRRLQLHPLLWEVDEPREVTLATAPDHVPDVVRWLQEPASRFERGGLVEMTYVVTNHRAFRARVYVLGTRVRVVAPDEFREELLAELRDLVGA
ncbi:WYL domain-containing protein [Nocardioides islandensis]|uniref:WYL domain-containing protein n=1 Tax=Nocardioides islandensis TaxID=433663 RepID=A0A930YJH4_9ACTN|nr:WYL domain-containing protein [Nocardioides islandensis]MBF4765014.1 WYL domain-containing protein [Nocardioides islandensis]